MRELERILKALASRRRLAILAYLKRQKEVTVGEIANQIKLSLRTTSKHLILLSATDIVEREQRGREGYYRLANHLPRAARDILHLV